MDITPKSQLANHNYTIVIPNCLAVSQVNPELPTPPLSHQVTAPPPSLMGPLTDSTREAFTVNRSVLPTLSLKLVNTGFSSLVDVKQLC